jgi:sugar transferase (PEP-CTERM/EpsH1 system associated)
MRVLYVTPYLPSSVRIRPLGFIRALSKRHAITLVTLIHPQMERRFLDEVAPYCEAVHLLTLNRTEALSRCALSLPTTTPLSVAFTQSSKMRRTVRELVRRGGYDLVHVEFARAAPLVRELAPDQAKVYDAVDSMTLASARTFWASHSLPRKAIAAFEWLKFRSYEAWAVRQFDHVLVSSRADWSALATLAPDVPLSILPNGVDSDYFAPREIGGSANPLTIAFLARLSYHANVSSILHFYRRVLPLIRAEYPDVRLLLIGRDPTPEVQALAADPLVDITGYVPDVRPFLARATVAISPMRVGAGVSNKVLEAMAMGLPVVATTLATDALAAEHDRELLIADYPADFADMVNALLSSPRLRRRIGRQARAYVEKHHRWPAIAERLEAIYQECIEGGAGRRADDAERATEALTPALQADSGAVS